MRRYFLYDLSFIVKHAVNIAPCAKQLAQARLGRTASGRLRRQGGHFGNYTPDEDKLMGTMTDQELAKRLGRTSREVLEALGRPVLHVSRQAPASPASVAAFAPVGVVQATSLGMNPEDPPPSPELLEAALPGARWAVEWIYKEDTAFALWARTAGLRLVGGATLFEAQAEAQSRRFLEGCG